MQVRRATFKDMIEMQHCNLRNLPENYNLRYYMYHYLSWPEMLYILEDCSGKIAGYVLAKLDDEDYEKKKHGHITSLAVLRTHRKLGAASHLMRASMHEMRDVNNAHYCSLHVRKTNNAALHLYQDSLKFRCVDVEKSYYVDDEDAYHMKRFFRQIPAGLEKSKETPRGINYITPSGEMRRCELDDEQLAIINQDMGGPLPPFKTAAEIELEKNVVADVKKRAGAGGAAAAAQSGGKKATKEDEAKNKAEQQAALAALLQEETSGKKGAAGGKKKK